LARGRDNILHDDAEIAGAQNVDMDKQRPQHFLRAWRHYRKLSQQQLADAIGSSKAVIGLLENGDRRLSDKWLRKLAPALGTQPGFILDHDPNDVPTSILDIWAEIPAESRPQAEQMLRALATGTRG
jgi:transcriptional regulator with XRE-family HTH domain